jgi:hypothetical protein
VLTVLESVLTVLEIVLTVLESVLTVLESVLTVLESVLTVLESCLTVLGMLSRSDREGCGPTGVCPGCWSMVKKKKGVRKQNLVAKVACIYGEELAHQMGVGESRLERAG